MSKYTAPELVPESAFDLDALRRVMLRAPMSRGADGHLKSMMTDLDALVGLPPINRVVLIAQTLKVAILDDDGCRRIVADGNVSAGIRAEIDLRMSGKVPLQAPLIRPPQAEAAQRQQAVPTA
ncbi:MAG: hypothetical protein E6Q67_03150 [Roseateles sp.]|nr:MAG: hypothetical protein E6Q67_03150 [Roseateles sp.]